MPSAFVKLLERIAAALGLAHGSEDPPRASAPRRNEPPPARATRANEPPPANQPPSAPPEIFSMSGLPIAAADCRACGFRRARPEYHDQFCSHECERRMADSLDAWHDQFQERFGEGDSVDEWRAKVEKRSGGD